METEVEALNADSSPIASLDIEQIVDHYDKIIRNLDRPPVIMGHSFGGAFTQCSAGSPPPWRRERGAGAMRRPLSVVPAHQAEQAYGLGYGACRPDQPACFGSCSSIPGAWRWVGSFASPLEHRRGRKWSRWAVAPPSGSVT
jgi:hypothetical protein